MAPIPLKQEFLAEYIHGMGTMFFLINARSITEILDRYPLFVVTALDNHLMDPGELEQLRMYPGEGRPLDSAVTSRSEEERAQFVVAALQERDDSRQRFLDSKVPPPPSELQYWVDIDDDAEFRLQMHELWKDDPRYATLPPERRLF